MNRTLLLIVLTGIIQLQSCTPTDKKETKPNIIVILADDLGYGDLGCYGAELIPTPNCDKLASQGMKFTDAHSPSSVCSPTRYSVLTGRYNWRSWLQNWVVSPVMPLLIDTSRFTMPDMMQQAGYTTGCIGKWHLGWTNDLNPDWNAELKPGPNEVGFDYFYGVPLSHNCPEEIQFYIENNRVAGLQEGESIYDSLVAKRIRRSFENTAIELSEKATQFIVDNKDEPFFMYYPTTGVHWPLTPNERFKGKSEVGVYGDFTVEFDWAVGEIMKTLDSLGIADNTLLIVTSDNGGFKSQRKVRAYKQHKVNGDLRGEKAMFYEGGHRIPFIARWPGKIAPATTSEEVICLTDFMATFADILDISIGDDAAEDSYSILPALLQESYEKPLREATVHHSTSGDFAIRKGDYKLLDAYGDGKNPRDIPKSVESGEGKPERDPVTGKFIPFEFYWPVPEKESPDDPDVQLYNLAKDPGETNNLYKEKPEVVVELKALLEKYKREGRSR